MTTVFVPTRGSQERVQYVIDTLRGVERIVFLTSHLTEPPTGPAHCEFIPGGTLPEKRHQATQIAKERGLTYCLQMDDDLGGDLTQMAEGLVDGLHEYPFLGATTALGRFYVQRGWVPTPVSHEFLLRPTFGLFFAIRLSAYEETAGFRLRISEDNDLGAQLAERGWLTGAFPAICYNHLRARTKAPEQGGFPLVEMNDAAPDSTAILNRSPVIKTAYNRLTEKGLLQQNIRWNWQEAYKRFYERWGIAYQDSQRCYPPV